MICYELTIDHNIYDQTYNGCIVRSSRMEYITSFDRTIISDMIPENEKIILFDSINGLKWKRRIYNAVMEENDIVFRKDHEIVIDFNLFGKPDKILQGNRRDGYTEIKGIPFYRYSLADTICAVVHERNKDIYGLYPRTLYISPKVRSRILVIPRK